MLLIVSAGDARHFQRMRLLYGLHREHISRSGEIGRTEAIEPTIPQLLREQPPRVIPVSSPGDSPADRTSWWITCRCTSVVMYKLDWLALMTRRQHACNQTVVKLRANSLFALGIAITIMCSDE
ncbi:hypothetical protein JJB99_09270 [Bradyrhizobium diazoefficiens]|uniref:hypothetical protein n=1 Tax=Bradyrhizobium diazoefficiens TaxID=1355477 RepID=UPI00190C7E4D|nr:hypothetical protein [Bradyrhizobium diazoefficiens]QQO16307.1 hypothetical protein JJB99_09270 [Bradyrhizobium diazoefficiens]